MVNDMLKDPPQGNYKHYSIQDRLAKSSLEAGKAIPTLAEVEARVDEKVQIVEAQKLLSSGQNPSAVLPARRELGGQLVTIDEISKLAEKHLAKELDGLPYTRQLTHSYNFRCLVTTKKNFIRVAPVDTQEGDQIFVVPRARVPMILRPVDEGRYELVRDTYIHGIMHGEAYNYMPNTIQEISIV